MSHNILYDLLRDTRVTVDDVSSQILYQPIDPLVTYASLDQCTVKDGVVASEALKLIVKSPLGVLLVYGRGKSPRGLVTRADLIASLITAGTDTKVTDHCTEHKAFVVIHPGATVESALVEFRNNNIKKLLVFDEDGTKLGVLKQQVLMDWVRDVLLGESQIGAA